jgi:hypothetical protein
MADYSCYLTILNQTRQTLTRTSYGESFGYWKSAPPEKMAANSQTDFQLADKAGPGGSTGWVRFAAAPGVVFSMSFDDPAGSGDNECKITMSGPATSRYRTYFEARSGGGNWQRNVCPKGGHPLYVKFTISTPMPRPPTPKELADLVSSYPNLDKDSVVVLGEFTENYNCIAWSLGINYTWINPPPALNDFHELYATAADSVHAALSIRYLAWRANSNWNMLPKGDPRANIDGWGFVRGGMKHASRQTESADFPAAVWTSKLGGELLITHNRDAFENSQDYGVLRTSFIKVPLPSTLMAELERRHTEMTAPELFTAIDRDNLAKALAAVPESTRQEFEMRIDSWLSAIREKLRFSSDTRDGARLPEFVALVAMGAEILPLVVDRIFDSPTTQFRLAVLYDALQQRPELRVSYGPDDPYKFEGEPARAARSAKLWLTSLAT